MLKTWVLFLFVTTLSYANVNFLNFPKSFNTSLGNAVFVDFIRADYFITYDRSLEASWVRAEMEFYAPEAGYPIFDLVDAPTNVLLNEETVKAVLVETPSKETSLRVINKLVTPGYHRLNIEIPLKNLVEYVSGGVKSAFWTSDLSDRNFLERYLPASFEFDQLKMTFYVKFQGVSKEQRIFTNGIVEEINRSEYKISYPEYFNSSSVYFHTTPSDEVLEKSFSYSSINGRQIPVTIYLSNSFFGGELSQIEKLHTEAQKVFNELEKDYGPWPHSQLIIYNAGRGGMEYCGATITELRALGHEMFHSYFARGVMPANGSAGWIDEALASWRDNGYQRLSSLEGSSRMSNHPQYTRITDRAAYSFGEKFMRLLDQKLDQSGGLKPFMRYMIENKLFSPFVIEEFINEMESFYGKSLSEDFKKYTFDNASIETGNKSKINSPIHHKMSLEELQTLL
jgi:hypothetical protein